MKPRILAAFILSIALLIGGHAFASGDRDGGKGGGRGPAVSGGGNRGGSVAVARGVAVSGGGNQRGPVSVGRGFSAPGRSFRPPGVAFEGRSYDSRAYTNRRGGNSGYTYAFHSHSGWNHDREYKWRGHHYRWYNNAWFIIDPFPYYYPDYPYYGYYGPASTYTEYAPSEDYGPSDNDQGPVTVQVQRELAREGYYKGPVDGIIGPVTRAAIAAYQRDNGLRPTGTINGRLLDALDLD